MKDNDDFLIMVGYNIQIERKKNNLTIKDMSRLLQLSEQTIGCIERGTRGTSLKNYYKISTIVDVSLDDLIDPSDTIIREPKRKDKSEQKKDKLAALCRGLNEEQADIVLDFITKFLDDPNEANDRDKKRPPK